MEINQAELSTAKNIVQFKAQRKWIRYWQSLNRKWTGHKILPYKRPYKLKLLLKTLKCQSGLSTIQVSSVRNFIDRGTGE